jgi:NDP-sugar pyrophosphorylase family protein
MQKDPILVIMAAGMGSRYGGLKQVDPIGPNGEAIIDYSLYGAKKAGFKRVIFIISEQMKDEFIKIFGARSGHDMETYYAVQRIGDLPGGFDIPEGRIKPWGTGHAVYAAREFIDAPFAVINADDYYGQGAFTSLYDFLKQPQKNDVKSHFAMVGYMLENTLSENGSVSRGICETGEDGCLAGITERRRIEKYGDDARYTEDDGKTWVNISGKMTVSMNTWGFSTDILEALEIEFKDFLKTRMQSDPLKAEFYLPYVVDKMISEDKADVKILKTGEKWYGITYRDDKETVVKAISAMHRNGTYPAKLW